MFPSNDIVGFNYGLSDGFLEKEESWKEKYDKYALQKTNEDKIIFKQKYLAAYPKGKKNKVFIIEKISMNFNQNTIQVRQDLKTLIEDWLTYSSTSEERNYKLGFIFPQMSINDAHKLFTEGAKQISLMELIKHCFKRKEYQYYKQVLVVTFKLFSYVNSNDIDYSPIESIFSALLDAKKNKKDSI
jgi:hypothetical protein